MTDLLARLRLALDARRRSRQLQRIRDYLAFYGHQCYELDDAAIVAAAEAFARMPPRPELNSDLERLAEVLAGLARGR